MRAGKANPHQRLNGVYLLLQCAETLLLRFQLALQLVLCTTLLVLRPLLPFRTNGFHLPPELAAAEKALLVLHLS